MCLTRYSKALHTCVLQGTQKHSVHVYAMIYIQGKHVKT